jgi:tRNA(Ile2) C34 agmatinyltransferase TiaS
MITREEQYIAGFNSYGAATITMCPGCGERTKCTPELHMCMGEHFKCAGCGTKWDSHPPEKK